MNEADVTSTYFTLIGYSNRELGRLVLNTCRVLLGAVYKFSYLLTYWHCTTWSEPTGGGSSEQVHFSSCDVNEPLRPIRTTRKHGPYIRAVFTGSAYGFYKSVCTHVRHLLLLLRPKGDTHFGVRRRAELCSRCVDRFLPTIQLIFCKLRQLCQTKAIMLSKS